MTKKDLTIGTVVAITHRLKFNTHSVIVSRPCEVVGVTKRLFVVDYGHYKESFQWTSLLTGEISVKKFEWVC